MKKFIIGVLILTLVAFAADLTNPAAWKKGQNRNLQSWMTDIDKAGRLGTNNWVTDSLSADIINAGVTFLGTQNFDTLNATIVAGATEFDDLATFDSATVATATITVATIATLNGLVTVNGLATMDSLNITTMVGSTSADTLTTVFENGAKNGATVVAVEYGAGGFHKTVLTCTATPITITDDAGVAQYGGVKVYDFPEGLIATMGVVIDGALTTTEPIIGNWDGDVALGTATATTGATLTGTEADILQSTATTQAVDSVGVCDAISIATALTETGARWFDGTATAKDAFLNFVIDDNAGHTGAMSGLFTGTITITWMLVGDK